MTRRSEIDWKDVGEKAFYWYIGCIVVSGLAFSNDWDILGFIALAPVVLISLSIPAYLGYLLVMMIVKESDKVGTWQLVSFVLVCLLAPLAFQ